MYVIGYETYLRKPTNDGVVTPGAMYYLGEDLSDCGSGIRPVTRFCPKGDISQYSDIMPGDNVDVEFGSYNGQLFIKNIKRKDV